MSSVVISIDAELGWGHHDVEPLPDERVAAGRPGWSRLLELLDRFELPATWAIVGHVFLEACDGRHRDHPTPEGWFARERGEWRSRPDLRFGTDLVEAVLDASTDHEIGAHSFSHVEFDNSKTASDLARAEIEASIDAASEYGIEFDSFVFPRNVVGHRELLADSGFRCYRGPSPVACHSSALPQSLLRLVRGTWPFDDLLLVEPAVDEYGLVNVPASMYLFSFEGSVRDVTAPILGDPVVRQARAGIDQAARRDGVFHVWLHPNNLVRQYTVDRLRAIFSYLTARRDAGDVAVETMRDVAERVQPADAPSREIAGDGA